MTELNIVPECEVDTRLVQILADITKRPNHQKGHGNVANKMLFDLKNQLALGIIDEDTIKVRKAKYFTEFKLIKTENFLTLQKHYQIDHYLIIIKPAIEKWLLKNAEVSGVTPENFRTPTQRFKKLHEEESNSQKSRFLCFYQEIDSSTGTQNNIP